MGELFGELSTFPDAALSFTAAEPLDAVLYIGAHDGKVVPSSVIIDFSDWAFSVDEPISARTDDGVIGPLLGACAGASQLFNHIARLYDIRRKLAVAYSWSALTLDSDDEMTVPTPTSIPSAHLVGVGAVGSAAIYTLGHVPALTGTLYAIDNDTVGDTNLQRYALMRPGDVEQPKPQVASRALTRTGLKVIPIEKDFASYVEVHGSSIPLLLTPVDSQEGRRHLAKSLPRRVLNVATGDATVTISHHGFADGLFCLHCLYLPSLVRRSNEEIWGEDSGLGHERVIELVTSNQGVTTNDIATVAAHIGRPIAELEAFVGAHIQSFYQAAVCGNAPMRVGGETLVAPLSFISAAAGVLLAAELLKLGMTGVPADYNYFRWNVLGAPQRSFRQLRGPEPSRRCICCDADYVEVHRRRYGA